ncbi:24-methylenesterol C-methyltransferase 2-like protein [Tanacetum coccineum]
MDSIALVCTASVLAVGLYWLVSMFGATDEKRKRDVTDVTFGSIDSERVKDTYNKYASFFSHPSEIKKDEKVPNFVNVFYDLVTDMYEYLWGQSFHFSPSIPGKSKTETARIHEEMAVDLINVKPGQKIIDVGCGVGGPMRAIAAHSGCNVVGITINEYQKKHGIVAKGTVDVQEMLLQPVLDLAKGGETGIFSPMQ